MAVRYAYLKQCNGESPFYVQIVLDGREKELRLYYHMGWWKNEVVDAKIFEYWNEAFRKIAGTVLKPKIKERKYSYRLTGSGSVSCSLLKDVIGFSQTSMKPELPSKLECYVNSDSKMIEVIVTIKYKHLGTFPDELLRLKEVFTENPDYETVRARLVFFNPMHVCATIARPVSPRHLPKHSDSPNMTRTPPPKPNIEFQLDVPVEDPTMDTRHGNPYAREFGKEKTD